MKQLRFALYLATMALCGAGIVVLFAPATHVAARGAGQSSAALSEDAQRGEKLFETNCAGCHGSTAKGSSMGVSLIDSSLVRHDKSGDLVGAVVHAGRPDKGMPAFATLSSTQTTDIAAFLHARITIMDSVETAGPRGGYRLQKLLTGNVADGKKFFDANCARCHAANGDLAGVAKKYQPAELEAKFLYPRADVATAVVTLKSGETVKGHLQRLDAFTIALTDADGNFHSWARGDVKFTIDDPMEVHVALLDRYTNKDVHDVFAWLETLQ